MINSVSCCKSSSEWVFVEIRFVFVLVLGPLLSMDFDHRIKGKTGSGPISDAQRQQQQRDRLLKLAMETSDVSKVHTRVKG